ncbi:hypothetical protein B0T25DRAFT_591348 [Lasiosphaeria hispida]|uniref:F-box domain-containing protein n=1 Tax=Lasiosphaeria hispida TaxID=260671 RepID=A0AAJ0MBW8_9PEZI|nr:hypothetical protein B0T25DRAFT_591348 [Lasiosphaeria hispida]
MAGFSAQPDEGYSEDPLNPLSTSTTFSLKQKDDAVSALRSVRSNEEFPSWLTQHISNLPLNRKTELAMALLSDLPTSVISQIVQQLNPRLYIDFICYLPPEICLKILGFLDPVSLIHVAKSCRAWYDLALDWKLWEQLYHMEGWKSKSDEIEAWEQKINVDYMPSHGGLQRLQSEEDGHAHKKRAIATTSTPDGDVDMVMEDAEASAKQEPTDTEMTGSSIFGDPTSSFGKTGISQKMGSLEMQNAGFIFGPNKARSVGKGKGRATSPEPAEAPYIKDELLQKIVPSSGLPQATLWMWDEPARRFKLNWRYLYTMRRRLESNWELGKFTNFQLPHPDHPEEGHGECIYSLQFNSQYLVSGSRDRTLKVWDMETRRCIRTLAKHRGSVLCLQFDSDPEEDIIVSGSSDSDVIIWSFSTGKEIQVLRTAHRESVLNVKFDKRILVTCSKDKTIKIFNRRPLRFGDLGYQEVDPIPRNVKNYGYSLNISPDDLPQTPAWTMIGCLEGHSAAVNAVQIHDREVVSASGDRHIKVWDWPTQACTRTIVGHTKGIACVQYDGRRIVSGSSDNEVKVFDRQTGLEVASLRSHSALVRTVQAGFGDLPYSVEDDAAEAKKVDAEYFKALESGLLEEDEQSRGRTGRRPGNAGSKRPQDICAYGAKLPPGGGGGKYGRIISGSYDTSIIIWRRDKEGIWKDQHHLKQEEAAAAAMRQARAQLPPIVTLYPSMRVLPPIGSQVGGAPPGVSQITSAPRASTSPRTLSAPPTTGAGTGPTLPPLSSALGMQIPHLDTPIFAPLTPTAVQHYHQIIDHAVLGGPQTLARALTAHPPILTLRAYVDATIDSQPSPVTRGQLRQTVQAALMRAQFEQTRQRRNQESQASGSRMTAPQAQGEIQAPATGTSSRTVTAAQPPPNVSAAQMAAAAVAAAAHQAHAQPHAPAHGVHLHQVPALPNPLPTAQAPAQHRPPLAHAPADGLDAANSPRVFKLQYDARRIICCSQTSVIVGWDFCNGDSELEEATRFFGHVQ